MKIKKKMNINYLIKIFQKLLKFNYYQKSMNFFSKNLVVVSSLSLLKGIK